MFITHKDGTRTPKDMSTFACEKRHKTRIERQNHKVHDDGKNKKLIKWGFKNPVRGR